MEHVTYGGGEERTPVGSSTRPSRGLRGLCRDRPRATNLHPCGHLPGGGGQAGLARRHPHSVPTPSSQETDSPVGRTRCMASSCHPLGHFDWPGLGHVTPRDPPRPDWRPLRYLRVWLFLVLLRSPGASPCRWTVRGRIKQSKERSTGPQPGAPDPPAASECPLDRRLRGGSPPLAAQTRLLDCPLHR